jgi:hypothetical protein
MNNQGLDWQENDTEENCSNNNDDIFDKNVTEYKDEDEETIKEVPAALRKIRTQPYDFSVEYLVNLIKCKENNNKGKIYLEPEFQRNAKVWDDKTASLLIESILLNVPIPPIYVSEEEDGTWNVIDGLQRVNTFKRFLNNEFKLRGLEAFPQLNKENYKTLNLKARSILDNGYLRIIVITKDSNPEMKYDIFMRLNRGSVKLTEQELRNCLYRGEFNNLLKRLCNNPKLLSILGLQVPHKRMADAELILRYFALADNFNWDTKKIDEYKGIMKTFLNIYMKNQQNLTSQELLKFESRFENTIEKVYKVFENNAFRKIEENGTYYRWINKAIFDFIMISFEKYSLEELNEKKDQIIELLKTLIIKDEYKEFRLSISSATSERNQLDYRLKIWIEKLSELLYEL